MQKNIEVLQNRQQELLCFENEYYKQGYERIAGVDEAGRGPLAGPLVVAAVVLNKGCALYGVDDSKKISEKKREQLYELIIQQARDYSIRIITPQQIDELNIYQATIQGMKECLDELCPQVALIDAMPIKSERYISQSIIKGDSKSLSIAAASILAKVTRDRIMRDLDLTYGEYGFAKHKGYPTKAHIEAVNKYGVTPCHRLSYEPIKSIVKTSVQG